MRGSAVSGSRIDPGSGGSLGQRRLLRLIGKGEPWHQRGHVGSLDGGTRPDAKTGRRIAVSTNVIGDTLLSRMLANALGERRLGIGIECR